MISNYRGKCVDCESRMYATVSVSKGLTPPEAVEVLCEHKGTEFDTKKPRWNFIDRQTKILPA